MNQRKYSIIGWDIGGVNIKAARIEWHNGKIKALHAVMRPFEIWKSLDNLKAVLSDIGKELGLKDKPKMAVTMTAELSDVFRNKREGVTCVLDAIEQAFEDCPLNLFNLEGGFFSPAETRKTPLLCAATNWLASALFIGNYHPNCILMDIGSTTTDIIPIMGGGVVTDNRTDTQRLLTGKLLYSGVLRTNPNTIVRQIPVAGRYCRVAAEYFCSMADVYLVLGHIGTHEYTCPTADGKAKSVSAARDRLSRLVCSDSELMSAEEIDALARYLWEKQIQQISECLLQVLSEPGVESDLPLAVVGTAGFLAKETARRMGMPLIEMDPGWGAGALASFPALSAAFLLAQSLAGRS